MKLKKANDAAESADVAGMTAVTDMPFDLGQDAGKPAKSGGVGATIALLCSLAAIAMLGVVAWLLYMNLELVQDV